jgi:hypothetical protein
LDDRDYLPEELARALLTAMPGVVVSEAGVKMQLHEVAQSEEVRDDDDDDDDDVCVCAAKVFSSTTCRRRWTGL